MKKEKRALFLLCIFYVLCMLTAGCKSTPEKVVILNKNDNTIYEKTEVVGDTVETPGKWTEEWLSDNEKLKITIEADVNVPNVKAYPVVNIVPMDISQDKATEMIRCLIGDKQLFKVNATKTKTDIEQEIMQIQNYLINELPNEETDPEMYKKIYDSRTETLKELYQELEIAPDQLEKKEITGLFESLHNDYDVESVKDTLKKAGFSDTEIDKRIEEYKNQINKNQQILGEANLGKEFMAKINIFKYSEKNQGVEFRNSNGISLGNYFYILDESIKNKISISDEKALNMAQDAIDDLGIPDMALYQKGYVTGYQGEENNSYYAYRFIFTRKINLVPVTYVKNTDQLNTANNTPLYNEPWPDEELIISVDDNGIVDFRWRYPVELKDISNSSAVIMPFDDIRQIFKDQIIRQNIWEDESIISQGITINRIELGLVKVLKKDSDGYMLIPAWDFFGSRTIKYESKAANTDENNEITFDNYGTSFLTINAIDGSIINRYLGY